MTRRVAGWIVLSTTLAAMPAGCTSTDSRANPNHTPKVLIIGDSISIGYFPLVQQLLTSRAEVYHNPGNAQHTRYGLEQLDTWLGDTKWDVIHFNHGLHDLKYVNDKGERVAPDVGHQMVPPDEYARNLEQLVKRLKKTRAELIFATTTPVPKGASGRIPGDAERYNRVALLIMKKHHVPIDDLYALARPRLDSIQRPRDVHFTPEGYRLLAQQVANSILKIIGS